ncbi:MAG: hypothetical protein QOG01_3681 [Pseudonocardiales bacterium]|jgi:hypothetical protein|nr:hypothetical protein [Pseudonocardiales bacterium]
MRAQSIFVAPLLALLACTSASSGNVAATTPAPTVSSSAGPASHATPTNPSGSSTRSAAATTGYADWPTYHGGNNRAGRALSMPKVSGTLRIARRLTLDGAVYASPIVVRGITVVATENNTVYAFNSRYVQIWKRHLGAPSPQSQRPCGNIDPLGITGTPVYDSAQNSVYVAPEYSGSPPRHELVSLNFATGAVKWHKSIDFAGVDRGAMQQRGALIAVGTRIWVPFGGLAGDCGQYKGRVVGLLRTDGTAPRIFTVPTTREAGIWTPPGPTADVAGNIFVSVGNGESGVGDPYDYSDSVLRLGTDGKRHDSFSPTTWASDNAVDLDLGSQGPAIVGPWIFIAGKSGTAYVLRRSHLGGIGGQVSSRKNLCAGSYGGTAANGYIVYVPCKDGVRAIRIDSVGTMHLLWRVSAAGSPVVGGGRIWSVDSGAGVLHAYDGTGASRGSIAVGTTSRFATPALYGRGVYVPTLTGLTVVSWS